MNRMGMKRQFFACVCFLLVFVGVTSVYAQSSTGRQITKKPWIYRVVSENPREVFIFSVDGKVDSTQKTLKLPSEVDGYKVVGLDSYSLFPFGKIERLEISENIRTIDPLQFYVLGNVKEFVVSPKNKHFRAVDGVLYTKDMKTLVHYPRAKGLEEYFMPQTVETVGVEGIRWTTAMLHSLGLSPKLKSVWRDGLMGIAKITTLYCPAETVDIREEGNARLSSLNNDRTVYVPEGAKKNYEGKKFGFLSMIKEGEKLFISPDCYENSYSKPWGERVELEVKPYGSSKPFEVVAESSDVEVAEPKLGAKNRVTIECKKPGECVVKLRAKENCGQVVYIILNVQPHPVSVEVVNPNKVYDGNATLSIQQAVSADKPYFALKGLGEGDADRPEAVHVLAAEGQYDQAVVGEHTFRVAGLELGGDRAEYYTLEKTDYEGTGEITKRPLSISYTGTVDREYDGTDIATIPAGQVEVDGIVSGDDVRLSAVFEGNYYGEATGEETVKAADESRDLFVGIREARLEGAKAGNYTLGTVRRAAIGHILPRTITVTLEGTVEKEYDGTTKASPAKANFRVDNAVAGEEPEIVCAADAGVYSSANVGQGITVTATISCKDSNYKLAKNKVEGAVGTITARRLALALREDKLVKEYDGTKALTLAPDDITLQRKIESSAVGVKAVEGEFVSSDAAEQVGVSLKTLELDGADKGNYSVDLSKLNISGRINPKKIAVTIADATIKAGEALPTFTYKVEPALCAGDALVGEPECEALNGKSGSEIRAGEYVIGKGTIAVGTGKASNYSIAVAEGKLTVEAQPGVEKHTAVDGEAVADFRVVPNPTQGYCRVEGLQESQTGYVFNMQGAMVGSYRVNRQGLLNLSHLPAGTYILRVGRTSLRLLKR